MNAYNIAGIISLIIERKIVKFSIEFNFFFMLPTVIPSNTVFPKHYKYDFISESFTLK